MNTCLDSLKDTCVWNDASTSLVTEKTYLFLEEKKRSCLFPAPKTYTNRLPSECSVNNNPQWRRRRGDLIIEFNIKKQHYLQTELLNKNIYENDDISYAVECNPSLERNEIVSTLEYSAAYTHLHSGSTAVSF